MRNRNLEETTEIPCIGRLFSSTPTGISPAGYGGVLNTNLVFEHISWVFTQGAAIETRKESP